MPFIGNQTSCWAPNLFEPFEFALAQHFTAFEWFPDKKPNAGWDDADIDQNTRERIKTSAKAARIRLSVHARCQSNPLDPKDQDSFCRDVQLASDLGAVLLNIHLFEEQGIPAFVRAIVPLIKQTGVAGLELSIENTPHHSPELFNELFAQLRALAHLPTQHVGMCFDIGHANLATATRNDYIGFLDRLDPGLPIHHLHLHENWGDKDSHLPLFTGPAALNDSGIRALLERLKRRSFAGSMILEQWPEPHSLLRDAHDRLLTLWGPASPAPLAQPKPLWASPQLQTPGSNLEALHHRVAQQNREARSWREKLELVARALSEDSGVSPLPLLVEIAIYLRFLGTGAIPCAEDGRHFRPAHHARLAAEIFEKLLKLTNGDNAFILRKIYPWLPSFDSAFRRAEPLTRIRDIAHRNDIPSDLKREIKTTLQNKLHRCAGPEDLVTSAALLEKITAPGTHYTAEFIEQFRLFHDELREFFNATSLEQRLGHLKSLFPEKAQKDFVQEFLDSKTAENPSSRLAALVKLTALRRAIAARTKSPSAEAAQALTLADISLDDYAFVLLSQLINDSDSLDAPEALRIRSHALVLALENLALSSVDPAECTAIHSELSAWGSPSPASSRVELLRSRASLLRARRLAENFGRHVIALFSEQTEQLGRLLEVPEHSIKVFCEADIRSHLVFQVSKLADALVSQTRALLKLSPWDTVVPGTVEGRAVILATPAEASTLRREQTIAIVQSAEGDEELPSHICGIALAHPIPHLSHLAVRARQAGVVFVSCEDPAEFARLRSAAGQHLRLTAASDQVSWAVEESSEPAHAPNQTAGLALACSPRDSSRSWLALEQATADVAGAKAAGARRLLELSRQPNALFGAPEGLVIPFGVMERALQVSPGLGEEYSQVMRQLTELGRNGLDHYAARLSDLIKQLQLPRDLSDEVNRRFQPNQPLAIRSSANTEDLESFAGAGLHESVINVLPADFESAVKQVWASLWTQRAIQSRNAAKIPHCDARMAVLIQELVPPEFSFVLHTTHPVTRRRSELYAEIVVGLGETLVSAAQEGIPYRLNYRKQNGEVEIMALANYSRALLPVAEGGTRGETIDYSKVTFSKDPCRFEDFGRRLGAVGTFIENAMGAPQDIEGVAAEDKIYLVQSRSQQGLVAADQA